MKFICEKDGEILELFKTTTRIVEGKALTTEAVCPKCGDYMKYIKEHEGFTTNIGEFQMAEKGKKTEILKKRSHEHFKKHIAEKKRDMINKSTNKQT